MPILVNNLVKKFDQQLAVDNVSFFIDEGEIVGFLGPNGAGKSTTMKIIAGYLTPTSGEVSVGGLSVVDCPLSVKQQIGYLSEHNPLYDDMYVYEYMAMVASFHNLKKLERKNIIKDIIERCGLTMEQHKKIGKLSKGYRQRIGLAQALVHNPKVLILDEPTSGLDPNQIIEIRKLIQHVSQNKTVLFSSHILQEVEALCDRIIVIHHGKIVANDRINNLKNRIENSIVVEFTHGVSVSDLQQLEGVGEVIAMGNFRFLLKVKSGIKIHPTITTFAMTNHLTLLEIKTLDNPLETIFRQLTQDKKTSTL